MKKLCSLVLLILFPFFLLSCSSSKVITINSFGASNVAKTIDEKDFSISKVGTPVRDDGAVFEGWYCSLNFDEEYKVTNTDTTVETGTLNAKYNKCYCFSLRYGTLGCFGTQDPNYSATYIDYFIPAGKYKVTFTEYSTAKVGSLMIMSNNGYTKKDGYPYKRQIDYNNKNQVQNLTLAEDEHLFITSNSEFIFQRTDVDSKYVEYNPSVDNQNNNIWGIVGSCIGVVIIIGIIVVIVKKKNNSPSSATKNSSTGGTIPNKKRDMFLYTPNTKLNEKCNSSYNKFLSKIKDVFEPVEAAIILESGFVNAIFITNSSLFILKDGMTTKTIKKEFNDFDRFEFESINLYVYFKNGEKFKLGLADKAKPENQKDIEAFEELIKSHDSNTPSLRFKFENGILSFNEEEGFIQFNEKTIKFEEIRGAKILIDSGQTTHSASLGGAIIGNIIAGGIGAIIGASVGDTTKKIINSAMISILTNNLAEPNIDIIISKKEIVFGTKEYEEIDKMSRRILNMIEIIIDRNKSN